MSSNNLRNISARYAKSGARNDFDEFRAEMDRIDDKQRHQAFQRYIDDISYEYPYLVRDRYQQFVPVWDDRLRQLIQLVIAQQQAIALKPVVVTQTVPATPTTASVVAEPTPNIDSYTSFFLNALPYILVTIAVLFVLMIVTMMIGMWQMMQLMKKTTVTKPVANE